MKKFFSVFMALLVAFSVAAEKKAKVIKIRGSGVIPWQGYRR